MMKSLLWAVAEDLRTEAFTRNFDLIAERKSVIFHLRELAKVTRAYDSLDFPAQHGVRVPKLLDVFGVPNSSHFRDFWQLKDAQASVMAKYLVDSKARIDPSWYRLADEIVKGAPPEPHIEIPQLWNMRGNSRIKLKNGRLIDMVTGRCGPCSSAPSSRNCAFRIPQPCQVGRASFRQSMAAWRALPVSRLGFGIWCRFHWARECLRPACCT